MRHRRSRHGLCALAILVSSLFLPIASQAEAAQLGSRAIDLTAIILTTADLEDAGLEGFGIWGASPFGLGDDVNTISNDQQLDANEVEESLDDAGYVGSYVQNQHLPAEADSPGGPPLIRVLTRVYAFSDGDGAADGFEIITDESEAGFDDEPGNLRLGDDAELTEMEFEADASFGLPYGQLELEILLDRLVLEVSLFHFDDGGDIAPFTADDMDTIEALGERLIERAEAALDGDTPNLLPVMVELDSDTTIAPYLTYYILDGDSIRSVWESESAYADRVEGDVDLGIVSLLRREQLLTAPTDTAGAVRFYNLTIQFDRERDAEDYIDGALDRLESFTSELETEELTDVPQVGDQSIALARGMGTDDEPWVLNQVLVRVGDTISWMWIQQDSSGAESPETSADTLAELGEAQGACLEAGRCDDLLPIPDGLQDIVDDVEGA